MSEMQAKDSVQGWMAIGLHDAGTSSYSENVPTNAMRSLDIVQVAPPALATYFLDT